MNEYHRKQLEPIAHLWKKDKDWIAKREAIWKEIDLLNFRMTPVAEKKKYKNYFIGGEKDKYIDPIYLFFLTPISTEIDAKTVFESDLFSPNDRNSLMGTMVFYEFKLGESLSAFIHHLQCFVNGVLGKEYTVLTAKVGPRERIYSPEPAYWCDCYMCNALPILRGEKDYNGCMECVDYFVSALAHADDPGCRNLGYLEELLQLKDDILEGTSFNERVMEFAQALKNNEEKIRENWALNSHLDA